MSAIASKIDTRGQDYRDNFAAMQKKLADLRSKLEDIPTEDLNSVLLGMERSHAIVLYPLDNPQEMHPEDKRAALLNSAGDERHVVYMENPNGQ